MKSTKNEIEKRESLALCYTEVGTKPIIANPSKDGDAKPRVYRCDQHNHDRQAAEDIIFDLLTDLAQKQVRFLF